MFATWEYPPDNKEGFEWAAAIILFLVQTKNNIPITSDIMFDTGE